MTPIELHELAARLALALTSLTGQDWRYVVPTDGPSHWSHIALGDSEDAPGITVQHSSHSQKLTVSGNFPRGDHGHYGPHRDRHTVGISASKPVEAIARDIARRLLPDYLVAWAVALETKRRDVEAHGKGLVTAQALSAILGDKPRETGSGWRFGRYGKPGIQCEVDPYSDDRRVKLTIDDLTQAEAEAVLAVVPKAEAQEGDES